MTYDKAAAICDGPWLAMNILKSLDLKPRQSILVNGASGSIGSSCVQLLKYSGATVTAVCSAKSIEIVRALGADVIIDYSKDDFTRCGQVFDAVIDAVGKSSFPRCKHLLKKDGIYVSTELGDWFLQNPLLALWTRITGGKRVKFPIPKENKADLLFFRELAEKGKLKAVIDRSYPLEEIVNAYRYVQMGQKIGSVVIVISDR